MLNGAKPAVNQNFASHPDLIDSPAFRSKSVGNLSDLIGISSLLHFFMKWRSPFPLRPFRPGMASARVPGCLLSARAGGEPPPCPPSAAAYDRTRTGQLPFPSRPHPLGGRAVADVPVGPARAVTLPADPAAAERQLRQIVEKEPNRPDAWYQLGLLALRRGGHPEV